VDLLPSSHHGRSMSTLTAAVASNNHNNNNHDGEETGLPVVEEKQFQSFKRNRGAN
jgi:hypothetical protein